MVDGELASIGQRVDPATAIVEIDRIRLPVRPDAVYYLLYKPVGTISTTSDELGRESVTDLVPPEPQVYPVGRLDADSEGLLILTNDGDFTHHLTHPRFGVTKTYTVLTTGRLNTSHARRLESGIDLDDGPAQATSARVVDVGKDGTLIEIVMNEGRNREVRRMVAELGEDVLRLVRTAIGELKDRDLKSGSWRDLTNAEVRRLYATGVGAAPADSFAEPWDNRADLGADSDE